MAEFWFSFCSKTKHQFILESLLFLDSQWFKFTVKTRGRRRWGSTYSQRSAWSVSCCTGRLRWHWRPSPWTCTCCWSGARPLCRWSPSPRTLPVKTHSASCYAGRCIKCVTMTPKRVHFFWRSVPFEFGGEGNKRECELVQLNVGTAAHTWV